MSQQTSSNRSDPPNLNTVTSMGSLLNREIFLVIEAKTYCGPHKSDQKTLGVPYLMAESANIILNPQKKQHLQTQLYCLLSGAKQALFLVYHAQAKQIIVVPVKFDTVLMDRVVTVITKKYLKQI